MSMVLAAASNLTREHFAEMTVARLRDFLNHQEVVIYTVTVLPSTTIKLNTKTVKADLVTLCLAVTDAYRQAEQERAARIATTRAAREAREAVARPAQQIGKSAHLSTMARDHNATTVSTRPDPSWYTTPTYTPNALRVDAYHRQNGSTRLTSRQARRVAQKGNAGK